MGKEKSLSWGKEIVPSIKGTGHTHFRKRRKKEKGQQRPEKGHPPSTKGSVFSNALSGERKEKENTTRRLKKKLPKQGKGVQGFSRGEKKGGEESIWGGSLGTSSFHRKKKLCINHH